MGVLTPTPLSYRCIGSNLAEFRITATLQQRDEYPGPKQLQVDGFSCQPSSTNVAFEPLRQQEIQAFKEEYDSFRPS